jgi:hypothetical protein
MNGCAAAGVDAYLTYVSITLIVEQDTFNDLEKKLTVTIH